MGKWQSVKPSLAGTEAQAIPEVITHVSLVSRLLAAEENPLDVICCASILLHVDQRSGMTYQLGWLATYQTWMKPKMRPSKSMVSLGRRVIAWIGIIEAGLYMRYSGMHDAKLQYKSLVNKPTGSRVAVHTTISGDRPDICRARPRRWVGR